MSAGEVVMWQTAILATTFLLDIAILLVYLQQRDDKARMHQRY